MSQKILDLLQKSGVKPELTASIGEALEQYKAAIREQFEADYTSKVDAAKKVCIEETEAHKRELARRMQVWCETKSAAIDAALQRQAALNESEAVTKLKTVRSLLEGVTLDTNGTGQNGQLSAVIEKAKRTIQQLTEERDQAVELVNKKNAIAEKALARNRLLTVENNQLKARGNGGRPVNENRQTPGSARIDGTRRAVAPVTSRPTIVENQDRRSAAPAPQGQTRGQGSRSGFGVNDIATQMEEDLI